MDIYIILTRNALYYTRRLIFFLFYDSPVYKLMLSETKIKTTKFIANVNSVKIVKPPRVIFLYEN